MLLEDTIIWVVITLLLAAGGASYFFPVTRPYAKKYGWALLAVVGILILYTLFRKRYGSIDDAIEGGQRLEKDNADAVKGIVDTAKAGMAQADAELHRKLIKSEEELKGFNAGLAATQNIDDSVARRKALIALVQDHS